MYSGFTVITQALSIFALLIFLYIKFHVNVVKIN